MPQFAQPTRKILELPPTVYCFYSAETPDDAGMPRNGLLAPGMSRCGRETTSFYDAVYLRTKNAITLVAPPSGDGQWVFRREAKRSVLEVTGDWQVRNYVGSEPDWSTHVFPFRAIPAEDEAQRHACVRGLLDFCAGTAQGKSGVFFQRPNTAPAEGYEDDGIPDTFFQFNAAYGYLSDRRKEFFHEQLAWLGKHMADDGAIPWGGCGTAMPYFHIWKRPDMGRFFDANGLFLSMTRTLWDASGIVPDASTIVHAADFYWNHRTPEGLIAAGDGKNGCEWADIIRSNWHSSLVNVIAFRGFSDAAEMCRRLGRTADQKRYLLAAKELQSAFNRPASAGGMQMANGCLDWRDRDGTLHCHWRIDANMLAIAWGAADQETSNTILKTFRDQYFLNPPAIPAPYLLSGSWSTPEDDMLDHLRGYGCGQASMPGRMAGCLLPALRRMGETHLHELFSRQLLDLVNREEFLYECYDHDGRGEGAVSYIEHALTPLLTLPGEKSACI
ncbi:MAG: hypothetical protein PHS41_08005 [Victivallaceae bacterium]|nr:hypothetical protein [Victivallaceae bacterium]